MPKIVRLQFQDANGQAVSGVAVNLSGNGSLDTNADGLAQFLVDDAASLVLKVSGNTVWSGASADLQARELFRHNGTEFVRS